MLCSISFTSWTLQSPALQHTHKPCPRLTSVGEMPKGQWGLPCSSTRALVRLGGCARPRPPPLLTATAGSRTGRESISTDTVRTREKIPAGRWGGCTLKPGEEGRLWLSAPIVSFLPSRFSFSPIRCVNPTHLFLHLLWPESRPLLLACSRVPKPSPSCSTQKGCPVPVSFLGCSPVSTCYSGPEPSPASPAQHTIPDRPESCDCPCKYSTSRLATSLWLVGPAAQPSPCPAVWDLPHLVPPMGSFHGNLHSLPVPELLGQCWARGCSSSSLG